MIIHELARPDGTIKYIYFRDSWTEWFVVTCPAKFKDNLDRLKPWYCPMEGLNFETDGRLEYWLFILYPLVKVMRFFIVIWSLLNKK